jgi:CelD/BcsL family acetyltransferase involved in cellulose biosynthesis
MALALELVDRGERARIQAIWTELAAVARPSYFLSWPWVENWLDVLPPDVRVQLAVVHAGGAPSAAFFLGSRRTLRHGFVPSRVRFLNCTGVSDYDKLVIEYNAWLAADATLTLRAVLDLLPGHWDELVLPALDAAAPPGDRLENDLGPYQLKVEGRVPCAVVDLERVRAEGDYLKLLSRNGRSQLRRAAKLYAEQGPLRLEIPATLDAALAVFAELLELHEKTWRARGEGGAFIPFVRAFHDRLIRRRFDSGEIQLLRLLSGGDTVGCLYNFVWDGVVYFYQSGIRYQEDGRLKPGMLCHVEAVRHNAAAGHRLYDFLAGDSQYKQSLATGARDLVWARIQKPLLRFRVEDALRRFRRWARARKRGQPVSDR